MKHIIKTLELAEELLGSSAKREISEIERDIILEKLRKLYSSILALEAEKLSTEEVAVIAPAEVEVVPADEDAAEEIVEEVAEEKVIAEEPEVEPMVEEEPAESLETIEEEIVVESESVVEEEPEVEEELAEVAVLADDPATAAEEAMLSLYDDDDDEEDVIVVEQPADEPIVEPEPEVEEPIKEDVEEAKEEVYVEAEVYEEPMVEKEEPSAPTILGEVLVEEQTRLGDTFVGRRTEADVASTAATVSSLRQSITLNDKYILMRDLFAGDNEYYNSVISELDSFESLEDAMLYIYDNHHWNPNSEGVLLLMDLLSRKLF